MKITFFDTETTGTDVAKDRIIQISLIKTQGISKIIEKKKMLFNNCGVNIHQKAFEAHGISEESIKDLAPFSSYSKGIYEFISDTDYIAGYNIKGFDIPILHEEFSRSGINWTPKPSIDCCNIFKNKEKRNLEAALMFYCGKILEGAHDAENDVIATIDVLEGQMFMYDLTEDQLVDESKWDDEDKRLDYAGKIILNNDNVAVWNFGKNKDKPIINDINYCQWVLGGDFTSNTKNIVRCLIG